MIGTVQMEKLLRIAKTLGITRVVLTGDTARLKLVSAGQPFHLLQKAGMATTAMDEVLRQKDPDLKEAVAHAHEGEAREAFTRLENRVTEHKKSVEAQAKNPRPRHPEVLVDHLNVTEAEVPCMVRHPIRGSND